MVQKEDNAPSLQTRGCAQTGVVPHFPKLGSHIGCPRSPWRPTLSCLPGSLPSPCHSIVLPIKGWMPCSAARQGRCPHKYARTGYSVLRLFGESYCETTRFEIKSKDLRPRSVTVACVRVRVLWPDRTELACVPMRTILVLVDNSVQLRIASASAGSLPSGCSIGAAPGTEHSSPAVV